MNTALSDFKVSTDAGGLSPSLQAEQARQGARATLSNQPQTTAVACCPGRFKSREEAGKAAVYNINKKSIADNKEYGGMIYQNPDGTFDYTGPISGNFRGVNPSDAPAPPGTTTVGNYHTHADYSIWAPDSAQDVNNITSKDIIRTGDPNRD